MLFQQHILSGIADGSVTLAFRRWRRPSVRTGGTLRTPVGELAILAVEEFDEAAITPAAARKAGAVSRDDLLAELNAGREGVLYRIRFRRAGADRRIALRERSSMTDAEFDMIGQRLERFDQHSRRGAWTTATLDWIDRNPGVRAGDLADFLCLPKEWIKIQVRKLKELGLTESLSPGYRISPRGRVYLTRSGRAAGCPKR